LDESPVQFIWVQLFLWISLVGPAPSKVSAAPAAPIDGALAAGEGPTATPPPPGPGFGAVGALWKQPPGAAGCCRGTQLSAGAATLGHTAKLSLFLPELKPTSLSGSTVQLSHRTEPWGRQVKSDHQDLRDYRCTWERRTDRAAARGGLEMSPAPWKAQGSSSLLLAVVCGHDVAGTQGCGTRGGHWMVCSSLAWPAAL